MFKEMNTKNTIKVIIYSYLLIMLFVGGYFLFQRYQEGRSDDLATMDGDVVFPENPKPGDPGYREPDRDMEVDNNEVYSGTFSSADNNRFSITTGGVVKDFGLPSDRLAIQCVSQNLTGTDSVDLDKVQIVLTPKVSALQGLFEVGEPLVVFVDNQSGTSVAHTVAVTYSSCPR